MRSILILVSMIFSMLSICDAQTIIVSGNESRYQCDGNKCRLLPRLQTQAPAASQSLPVPTLEVREIPPAQEPTPAEPQAAFESVQAKPMRSILVKSSKATVFPVRVAANVLRTKPVRRCFSRLFRGPCN